jgi:hypothetical protein
MEIRLASLISGAEPAIGTTVIIDVFRAFTTAAVALSGGARRIVMVDTLDKALVLRSSGVGDYCIGERDSIKPPGFDFGKPTSRVGAGRGGREAAGPDYEQRDGRDQRRPLGKSHLRTRPAEAEATARALKAASRRCS